MTGGLVHLCPCRAGTGIGALVDGNRQRPAQPVEIDQHSPADVAAGHAAPRAARHQGNRLRGGHTHQGQQVAHVLGNRHGVGHDADGTGAFAVGAPCRPIGMELAGESGGGVDRHPSM